MEGHVQEFVFHPAGQWFSTTIMSCVASSLSLIVKYQSCKRSTYFPSQNIFEVIPC